MALRLINKGMIYKNKIYIDCHDFQSNKPLSGLISPYTMVYSSFYINFLAILILYFFEKKSKKAI